MRTGLCAPLVQPLRYDVELRDPGTDLRAARLWRAGRGTTDPHAEQQSVASGTVTFAHGLAAPFAAFSSMSRTSLVAWVTTALPSTKDSSTVLR